jgi:16S rRNA (adenine1518-N6/adenine1519-N6)-dimethyltransferase
MLTRELAARAGKVIAVELDRDLAGRLQSELPEVDIIQGDILDWQPPSEPYKVVANLPYYITAPVLRHFLAGRFPPTLIVAMVQHEVAKTITAGPGDMSLLAIAVQFYGKPALIATVSPGSFTPPPKVRSAIIRVDTYTSPPVDVPSPEAFFRTVRAGFAARRKQLRNSLAQGLPVPAPEADRILATAGIDPQRRAETLMLDDWARLTHAVHGHR